MTEALELMQYDAWTPEEIVLKRVEALPWANEKTRGKAIDLARGIIRSLELGLPSQVNLYFANLKRLAKKSVADSIRNALQDVGLVLEPSDETKVKVEDYEGMIPSDMLDVMALIEQMIPVAQFKIGVPCWRTDPYLLVGIPGGAWYRLGSWYRGAKSHILVDAGKVDIRELLSVAELPEAQ
jgi:hypothetical protein